MVIYLEIIFRTILCFLNIGLMQSGRVKWQEAEATRTDFNIVPIHQDKKFFISELSKVIQDATHWSLTAGQCANSEKFLRVHFITLDVQWTYTPSQVQDWYLEDKTQSGKNRRYSLRLWIPWTRNTKIRTSFTWPNHVLHATRRKHRKDTKTQCIGSKNQLAQRKGLKFYQTRSNAIILSDTLPAYCIPKAIMMGTGEIIYEEVYASPRPPPKISFKDNWMKELGSEVAGGGKNSQQPPPKTNNSIVRTGETCFVRATIRFECSGNRKRF